MLAGAALAFAFLQSLKHHLGAFDHGGGQAGQSRDLHAITAVCRAFLHLVQEDHVAMPFLDRDRGIFDTGKLPRQRRHLMVVGREKRPAAVHVVQMFERGPGDGKPVIGRGAAPDFVEDHQRPVVGLIEDGGGFDHLDHEGRPPARQIVGGAHAAEKLADQADTGL